MNHAGGTVLAEAASPRDPVRVRLWALLAASTVLHLGLCGLIGLSVDESYAVVMGRRFALSYYDHPPLLFWLPGAMARLAGSEGRFVVRLPFMLLFLGTTWMVFRLGTRLFGERAGLWAALSLNLVLFFTLCTGTWILPDGPLLFFSAAAALLLVRVTVDAPPAGGSVGGWLGFGVACGLALLSKYHAVFLLGGAGAFLLTTPRHRPALRTRGPYLAVAAALLLFLPVLAWNAQHDFASFRFQSGRARPALEAMGTPFVDTLLGQGAWMLPWMWIPLLAALARALRAGPREERRWLLVCLGLGPIGFFTLLTAFGSRGLPHWQAPGYFMLLPLLGAGVAERVERGRRGVRAWAWASALGLLLVLATLVTHVSTGWIDRAAPRLLDKGDPTTDLVDWSPLASQLRRWGYPRPGVELAAATWADAAKAAYALGPGQRVYCVGDDPRGFHFDVPGEELVGRDILLIVRRRPGPEPGIQYAPYFDHLTPLGTVGGFHGHEDLAVSAYLGRRLLRPVPSRVPL